MKRILLVEDTLDKANAIRKFLTDTYGADLCLTESGAYKTAQHHIFDNHQNFDLILLDMTMSTFDPSREENGGTPEPVGGKKILEDMYLREINTKVLVVTMYKEFVGQNIFNLDTELKENFPDIYYGYVFFSYHNDSWQQDLKNKIESLLC